MSTYFHDLVNSDNQAVVTEAAKRISDDPLLHAIMRNTIAPVLLNAGFRGNVIPGSAQATLNLRVIPGTKSEDMVAEIKHVIDHPNVDVAPAPARTPQANELVRRQARVGATPESSTETLLYKTLTANATSLWHAPVTPYLFQAGTDAIAWRSRGIPVYGVYPYPITNEDLTRMHGNDERVSVESLEQGKTWIYNTLLKVAGSP